MEVDLITVVSLCVGGCAFDREVCGQIPDCRGDAMLMRDGRWVVG